MQRSRPLAFVMLSALFLLVLPRLTPAQDAPPPPGPLPRKDAKPTKPAPPPGRITGTVYCADTHKPARSAMLMLERKPHQHGEDRPPAINNQMARVGMDGAFMFANVPPGEYAVIALLPGYLSPLDGVTVDIENGDSEENAFWKRAADQGTVTIAPSETARMNIEVQRGAAISGRVLYSDGSPATQVLIDLENTQAKPTGARPSAQTVDVGGVMRTMFTHQSRSTDDTGRFRIAGLAPGTYRVAALHDTGESGDDNRGDAQMAAAMMGIGANAGMLHIYAGDTVHQKAAKTYELRAGDDITGVDITVPVAAFHSLSGHVAAKDGRSLNMGKLLLTDKADPTYTFTASVNADGGFRFPAVTAGTYTLVLTEARIGGPPPGPEEAMARFMPLVPKFAFADTTQDVILGENNLQDVNIVTTEVPLPPQPKEPELKGIIPD